MGAAQPVYKEHDLAGSASTPKKIAYAFPSPEKAGSADRSPDAVDQVGLWSADIDQWSPGNGGYAEAGSRWHIRRCRANPAVDGSGGSAPIPSSAAIATIVRSVTGPVSCQPLL